MGRRHYDIRAAGPRDFGALQPPISHIQPFRTALSVGFLPFSSLFGSANVDALGFPVVAKLALRCS